MKSKLLLVVFVTIVLCSIVIIPLASYCQDQNPPTFPTPGPSTTLIPTSTPETTTEPTSEPTSEPTIGEATPWKPLPTQNSGTAGFNSLLVGGVGVAVIAAVGASAFIVLKKRRVSERSLRRFSSQEFQNWVLKRIDGKTSTSRDSAMGIDGFTAKGYPVLIKQSDGVGMVVVDNFASALAKNRARNGVIVAFNFGSDAIRGKVRAKMNYGTDIEMLTVNELIYSKRTL